MYIMKSKLFFLVLLVLMSQGLYAKSLHDMTPLHWACDAGDHEIARKLLESGANVDAVDGFGRTPLHFAVDYPEVVRVLIEYKAQVNIRDVFEETPLFYALGNQTVVSLLLEAKAKVNVRNTFGKSPLDYCTMWGRTLRYREVIELLLGAGAQPNL